jgi:uncharacterized DUF497 family protein
MGCGKGASFEEAASVFRGFCLQRLDSRRDYGETRFVALGLDSNGVALNVVYRSRRGHSDHFGLEGIET